MYMTLATIPLVFLIGSASMRRADGLIVLACARFFCPVGVFDNCTAPCYRVGLRTA